MKELLRRVSLWGLPAVALGVALFACESGWSAPSLRGAYIGALQMLHPLPSGVRGLAAHTREANFAFVTIAGLAIIALLISERLGAALAVFGGALVVTLALSFQFYAADGLLFDPSVVALSLFAIVVAGVAAYVADGAGIRGKLERVLKSRVPPGKIGALAREPALMNMDGETRTMTYLVCNIRGYSELAERFASNPEGLSRLTRRVLSPLVDTVLSRGGTMDRITPGGLTAFFNAPVPDPQHAIHACECAIRMVEVLDYVNRGLENDRPTDGGPVPLIEVGIGINSGPGVVADFGTPSRPEYSVTGRAAALAAHIEHMSAKYGPAIAVGNATQAQAEHNFAFLEVDVTESGDSGEPTPLFALLGNPLVRASPKFRALQTFHGHIFSAYYGRDWSKARALIDQCRKLSGASPRLYDLYLKRIAYFEQNPPPDGWKGAVRTELE